MVAEVGRDAEISHLKRVEKSGDQVLESMPMIIGPMTC